MVSPFAGIQTSTNAKFYALSAAFDKFSNEDKTLVVQFTVKHEQKIDCGGGYAKVIGLPYSGKFSYGANFCIFRMKPRDTKIKTAKMLTVEILTSNFERAIEHVEAASKRWCFITVFLAFERPSRLQWTRLHPLACYDNETQRGK